MLQYLATVVGIIAALLLTAAALIRAWRRPNALEELGVRDTYPRTSLPQGKIEAYNELKDRLKREHSKGWKGNDIWMSKLPKQAKDMLKYQLMQRAIGDVAALQKTDADARGYWRLFSKGVITQKFWNSVVELERELSRELESVKTEASWVEPDQDPQGIISEAMHLILRYGADKLPNASDVASTTDAIQELMQRLPAPPGHPMALPPPGMGHPGQAPGGPLRGPGGQPLPQSGGTGDAYTWRQDTDEIEISVSVPNNATKAEIKITFSAQAVKVEHSGEALCSGKLAGIVDVEGCTWTMGGAGKGVVVVTLEKANPKPWPGLFVST